MANEKSNACFWYTSRSYQNGSVGERIPKAERTGGNGGMRNRTAPGNAGSSAGDIRHQAGL